MPNVDDQLNDPAVGGFAGTKLEIVIEPGTKLYTAFAMLPFTASILASDHVWPLPYVSSSCEHEMFGAPSMKIGGTLAAAAVPTPGPTRARPSMPATASQPRPRNRRVRPFLRRVGFLSIDTSPPRSDGYG